MTAVLPSIRWASHAVCLPSHGPSRNVSIVVEGLTLAFEVDALNGIGVHAFEADAFGSRFGFSLHLSSWSAWTSTRDLGAVRSPFVGFGSGKSSSHH